MQNYRSSLELHRGGGNPGFNQMQNNRPMMNMQMPMQYPNHTHPRGSMTPRVMGRGGRMPPRGNFGGRGGMNMNMNMNMNNMNMNRGGVSTPRGGFGNRGGMNFNPRGNNMSRGGYNPRRGMNSHNNSRGGNWRCEAL